MMPAVVEIWPDFSNHSAILHAYADVQPIIGGKIDPTTFKEMLEYIAEFEQTFNTLLVKAQPVVRRGYIEVGGSVQPQHQGTASQLANIVGIGTADASSLGPHLPGQWPAKFVSVSDFCSHAARQRQRQLTAKSSVGFDSDGATNARMPTGLCGPQVRSYFLVFAPTIREIREFYREM
eukprot:SAG31_NODE_187_length_20848_cov_22.521953_8_plen_178_part_00